MIILIMIQTIACKPKTGQWITGTMKISFIIIIIILLWIIRQSHVLSTVILHYDILGMHYIAKIYKYIHSYVQPLFSENSCVARTSHIHMKQEAAWIRASSTAWWHHRSDWLYILQPTQWSLCGQPLHLYKLLSWTQRHTNAVGAFCLETAITKILK